VQLAQGHLVRLRRPFLPAAAAVGQRAFPCKRSMVTAGTQRPAPYWTVSLSRRVCITPTNERSGGPGRSAVAATVRVRGVVSCMSCVECLHCMLHVASAGFILNRGSYRPCSRRSRSVRRPHPPGSHSTAVRRLVARRWRSPTTLGAGVACRPTAPGLSIEAHNIPTKGTDSN
jgi:hypothetical protein